jgi:hypothetical protein
MQSQKGFAVLPMAVIIGVVVIIGLGGFFAYKHFFSQKVVAQSQMQSEQQTQNQQDSQQQNTQDQTKVTINATTPGQPAIRDIQPNSGTEGTTVTITGSGFTTTGNSIYLGTMIEDIVPSNGTTLTFTISGCPYASPRCPAHLVSGPHMVSVSNAHGTSNQVSFTVNASGTTTTTAPQQYVCQMPCGGVPPQFPSSECTNLTTQAECTGYSNSLFPYHCNWVPSGHTCCSGGTCPG